MTAAAPHRTSWAPIVALGLAMLVVTSDITMASVALPDIGRHFGIEAAATAWVVLAYSLPMAAASIPVGRWADGADARVSLLVSMIGVGAASILAAAAPTFWLLITARLLQGLAGALVVAVYMPIVSGSVRPDQRGKAIGSIITIMTLGGMAGAPLGGLVAGAFGWRMVFLIKIPLVLVVLWTAWRTVAGNGRGMPRPSGVLVREGLLLGAAISALLLAVQGIADTPVLAAATGVVTVALFVWWGRLPASRAVLGLVRSRAYGFALLALASTSLMIGLTAFLLPFYVADVLHGSAELTGVALLFFVGSIAPASVVSGWLTDKAGPRYVAMAGSAVMIVGMGALLTLDAEAGLVDMAWRLAITGFGAGLFNPAINTATLAATPAGMEGTSGGVSMTARSVSMTVGPGVVALGWTLAGGGLAGYQVGTAVVTVCTVVGLLALLVPPGRVS
ncbi:MFS transporter [Pseudonocardia sp. TRM90224]|uniref:MFS transporter n=1 Tax=Pseudonocardia sp. TRM90224 TaxID=2812678 RepID=UPI001E2BE8AE|nr:MFS transporter [Pseudonocardia sp. TRM90224]